MKNKGSITIETMIVFPLIISMIMLFILAIITITEVNNEAYNESYMERVNQIDSVYRKTRGIQHVFE